MAAISGSQTAAIIKTTSGWGTATAGGTGNRFIAEPAISYGTQELTARQIGSGASMVTDVTRSGFIPTISLTGDLGYRNNWDVVFAAFFGTAATPTETTTGQGDYLHTLLVNTAALNPKYLSYALTSTSSTSIEFPSCAVRSIGFKSTTIPGYVDATAELLGNDLVLASAVNTYSTISAATSSEAIPELVTTNYDDTYRSNAQGGSALASGDQFSITSFDFSMSHPQESKPEIKGSAGISAPVESSSFEGTFNVGVKQLDDHTYFTAWLAETSYKARLSIEGSQIGTGVNKRFTLLMPRLKQPDGPAYSPTDPGTNPVTLNFRLLKASTAPSGMTSAFPHIQIVNTLTTSLLA